MPLDGLSHHGDIRLYLLHLLRIEGRGRWLRCDLLWRGLGNGYRFAFDGQRFNPTRDHLFGLRRPAKFRGLCRDYLPCCLAVRPSQDGCNTNTNRDNVAKPSRGQPFRCVVYRWQTITNYLSLRSLVVEVMTDRQKKLIHFLNRFWRRAWMQQGIDRDAQLFV